MAMTKVGQAGRYCILSCLLLAGFLFAGCQTNKVDSGFSDVPGMETGAPAANQTQIPPSGATNSNVSKPAESFEIIKPGDTLIITFSDLPKDLNPPPFEQRVKDDGTITLLYNQRFQAAGKRTGDLESEIRAFYVPSYFIYLTVGVHIPEQNRFYYVDGEVKAPGKFPYVSGITVSKAIAAASGFTDFASKRRVKLIRDSGKRQTVNCNKVITHPELDPLVFPNDKIHVPRRIL